LVPGVGGVVTGGWPVVGVGRTVVVGPGRTVVVGPGRTVVGEDQVVVGAGVVVGVVPPPPNRTSLHR
jgi:hypothetical protein